MKRNDSPAPDTAYLTSLTPVAVAVTALLALTEARAEYFFNPAFLSGDPSAVADLSRFSTNGQAPGVYRVDIWLNEHFIATRDITFDARKVEDSAPAKSTDDTGLVACLSAKSLENMGVNLQALSLQASAQKDNCTDVAGAIPDASTTFDFEKLRLNISIPQVAMRNNARGYIPPDQWDEGINALLLNYNFSGSRSRDRGTDNGTSNNAFLGLNSGLNIGPWRLRDNVSWNHSSSAQGKSDSWQHISTYAERTVVPLQGRLTLGDSYTPSDVFDSLPFRGAQIASDDNMLPDSMKGFAPTIRGIAKSHAQVTIRQNGYVIYQSYVPPGAFAINDLFPTSSSGDLMVEVKEADGSINSYSVPYSAVPILQREGRLKYALTAAEYRSSGSQQDDVEFIQGSLIWGLPHGLTAYGGSQLTRNYTAAALGAGLNMGEAGALSVDVTHAKSRLADDSSHSGQSIRFLYAKSLNAIGTNFQLLGYRYSTSGFYTLDETAYRQMRGYKGDAQEEDNAQTLWMDYYNLYYTKRGKVQFNLSQQLPGSGSVYVTGSQQSYWHTDEKNTLLQIGYSGTWADVSWSLSYNYNKAPGMSGSDEIYALNISLPLNQWLSPQNEVGQKHNYAYATYSLSTNKQGDTSQNAGINGTLLEDNNLSYSVQQGYTRHGSHAQGASSMEYDSAYGNASVGYNYSQNGDYQQVNYGLNGGVIAHRNGITLSQPLGDTNVLIAAPGAKEVKIENEPGIHTDWRGYAVVPYASSYRLNRMALDTNSLADDVDIDDAVTHVVPTRGAVVRATFKARPGTRALMTLLYRGKPVPFGAMVTRDDGGSNTIVGEEGETYLSGLNPTGTLNIQWGEGANRQCTARYQLPESKAPLVRLKMECL
ncbi:fimbrial biogenesis usher protein [Enterobacter sp. E12]|uniref:fimbrial biogenesis usher protein n=1 Tax=Enterobacter TaxID=547 RepID=UPI0016612D9D|nr:fimbrial biogenesis usher protein [Enterobacter sp. E12]MBD0814099.1 fimbrial biogenesis usher protein [Enterobacter sp. E12]